MNFDGDSTSSIHGRPASAEEYVRRVASRLVASPDRERRVDELRSHIAERYAQLDDVNAVTRLYADFGAPEEYAARLSVVDDSRLDDLVASGIRARKVAGVILLLVATLFTLLGLVNVLALSGKWSVWSDAGLGQNGSLVLAVASWVVALIAGVLGWRLWRSAGES